MQESVAMQRRCDVEIPLPQNSKRTINTKIELKTNCTMRGKRRTTIEWDAKFICSTKQIVSNGWSSQQKGGQLWIEEKKRQKQKWDLFLSARGLHFNNAVFIFCKITFILIDFTADIFWMTPNDQVHNLDVSFNIFILLTRKTKLIKTLFRYRHSAIV